MKSLIIFFLLCASTFTYGDMGEHYTRKHLLRHADVSGYATFQRKFNKEKIALILKKGKIHKLTPDDKGAFNIPKFTEASQLKGFDAYLHNFSVYSADFLFWSSIFSFSHGVIHHRDYLSIELFLVGMTYWMSRLARFLPPDVIEKEKYYENMIFGHIHTRPSDVNVLALGVHRSDFIDVVDFLLSRSFIMEYAREAL